MASRLREAAEQTARHQELDALGRLADVILGEMDAHGQPDPQAGTRVAWHLTHQEIADRIGTARETVSRALSRLRALGAVRIEKGYLVVSDPAKLRRYCGP